MPSPRTHLSPDIAVIGGSGFYTFLDEPTEVAVTTPYGDPSAPIATGLIAGRLVAFLPRHGVRHQFPPHQINYRANIWALRSIGVRRILAPCAVGSLRPDLGPGQLVAPDQLVDRTTGRCQTFMDEGAVHVSFADPYCPELRRALTADSATPDTGADPVVDGGTMVVIDGPRFSTRAESQWYAAQGWALVNMTGHPEAVLTRELAMCYAPIAVVTDHDAGIAPGAEVRQRDVFAEFAHSIDTLRRLLTAVIAGLPQTRTNCRCGETLDGLVPPFELPGQPTTETKQS